MTYPLHRFRFACAVLLAGFTFAASSTRAADIKMPAELPPYGPMQLPQAPKVQSEKLANGLTVWLVQQNNLPKAAVTLTLRGGYCADPADARGFPTFLRTRLSLVPAP
jgi:hypothetical protein